MPSNKLRTLTVEWDSSGNPVALKAQFRDDADRDVQRLVITHDRLTLERPAADPSETWASALDWFADLLDAETANERRGAPPRKHGRLRSAWLALRGLNHAHAAP